MAREGDLLRVAAKLQEAALGSEAWPEALSSFSTLFGSAWTVVGAFARDPSPRYAWVTQDADGAPDHLVVFRDRYNTPDSNPAIKALVTAPPGSIVAREHTFSDRQWSSEPLYREIYRPRGLYHGLGMCVLNNDSHLALIGINRPRAAGRFSEREIEKLR